MDKDAQVRALMEKVRMLEAQLVEANSPKPVPAPVPAPASAPAEAGGLAVSHGGAFVASPPSSPPRRDVDLGPASPMSTPGGASNASHDGDLDASGDGGRGAGAGAGSESDADVERVETAEQEERRIRFQELVLRGVEEEEEARDGGSEGGGGGGGGSAAADGAGVPVPPLPVGVVEDKLMESPLRRSRSLPQVIPSRPMTCDARPMTADEVFIAKVVKNLESLVAGRKPVVLVSTGSYNPIHLQHARMFYLARKYLTERTEMQVVGGVLSPAHDAYVRGQCRRFPAQAIPVRHRVAMAELAVEGSSWLSVRRWEATRRTVMDYRSVLKNVQQLLDASFPSGKAPHVLYLCGADHLLMCGPQTLKEYGCICCSRPGFTEELERAVGKKYRRLVHIVDDDALLTTALDSVSSTKVRKRMMAGSEVRDLVGATVASYLGDFRVGDKVAGRAPWTDDDKEPVTFDVGHP